MNKIISHLKLSTLMIAALLITIAAPTVQAQHEGHDAS